MPVPLDIEQPDQLLNYLKRTGRLSPNETPRLEVLRGGVSNRTVLVERRAGGSFVLKQALERLRVTTEWHSDPRRIHCEALGLIWLSRLAPAGAITRLVFEDPEFHLLAMEAVPIPHENWKSMLLQGRIDAPLIRQFGELLAAIHRQSTGKEFAELFADRTFFETLRLEPYYRFTATRVPEVAGFLAELVKQTQHCRCCLVHGDYSPKNVLIRQDRLILLDHEVIHFGDPAFDLGFSLTHFLSKAHHLAHHRSSFLQAACDYWHGYRTAVGQLAEAPGFEARVCRHTLACLLARAKGRSPLEYLSERDRERQCGIVVGLLGTVPTSVDKLAKAFGDLC